MKRRDFVLSTLTCIQTGLLMPSLGQATAARPSAISRPTAHMRSAVIGMGGWGTRAVEEVRHFFTQNATTESLFAAALESGSLGNRVIGRYGEIPRKMLRQIDDVAWMKDDLRGVDVVIFVAHLMDPTSREQLPRYAREAVRLGHKAIVGVIAPTEVVDSRLVPIEHPELETCIQALRSIVDQFDLSEDQFASAQRIYLSNIPDGTSLTDAAHEALLDWHLAGTRFLGLYAAAESARAAK